MATQLRAPLNRIESLGDMSYERDPNDPLYSDRDLRFIRISLPASALSPEGYLKSEWKPGEVVWRPFAQKPKAEPKAETKKAAADDEEVFELPKVAQLPDWQIYTGGDIDAKKLTPQTLSQLPDHPEFYRRHQAGVLRLVEDVVKYHAPGERSLPLAEIIVAGYVIRGKVRNYDAAVIAGLFSEEKIRAV